MKNYNLPDYAEYRFTWGQRFLYLSEGSLLVIMVGYFFYQSWIACVCLFPLLLFFLREKKKELAKRRRQELSVQFKDLVLSLSANQRAGYSIENAFKEHIRIWKCFMVHRVLSVRRYGIFFWGWKTIWHWKSFSTVWVYGAASRILCSLRMSF